MRIDLRGPDGNSFFILGKVEQLLKIQGHTPEEIGQIMADATSGDYDHLLDVCQKASGVTYVGRPRRSKKTSS